MAEPAPKEEKKIIDEGLARGVEKLTPERIGDRVYCDLPVLLGRVKADAGQ